jgi:hypothetical protein
LLREHDLLVDGFDWDPEMAEFLGALLLNSTALRFPMVQLDAVEMVGLIARPALLHGCARLRLNNSHFTTSLDEEKVFFFKFLIF